MLISLLFICVVLYLCMMLRPISYFAHLKHAPMQAAEPRVLVL